MAKCTAQEIKNTSVTTENKKGQWVPVRSESHTVDSFLYRVKLAWGVFTGKYDALDWQEDQYRRFGS